MVLGHTIKVAPLPPSHDQCPKRSNNHALDSAANWSSRFDGGLVAMAHPSQLSVAESVARFVLAID